MQTNNDLIERKDAINAIEGIYAKSESELSIKAMARAVLMSKSMVPTVDAAPVVHAKWRSELINGRFGPLRCTNCSNTPQGLEHGAKYCQYCGARMDGGPHGLTASE